MKKVIRRRTTLLACAMMVLACAFGSLPAARAQSPSWLSNAVIYCVNPEIFSLNGIKGVTAQLPRLQKLGVNVIWLMPIYPRGNPITVGGVSRPAFESPYDIQNFEGIDPAEGTGTDLTNLITSAHNLGMKVILDLALNCTSWDNPLVTQHPEYYIHTDGNNSNLGSIQTGWGNENDVAQLNLTGSSAAQSYVQGVCTWWMSNYGVDGFRFDSADNPSGSTRSFPASLANSIRTAMNGVNSSSMMLGEEEIVDLALNPYDLDYSWNMWWYGVLSAFGQGNGASTLQYQWTNPYTSSNTSPSGMLHMNMQDNWDLFSTSNNTARDIKMLGGYPQAMAAAVFNCTISGVPLIYNGMEVANITGYTSANTHAQIDWAGVNSNAFNTFYQQLLALRNNSGGALQQGTTTWVSNSSSVVSSCDRTGGGQEYLIEINTSTSAFSGTISAPAGGAWIEVTPAGAPGGQSHTNPGTGNFSLAGDDFAIFKRSSAAQSAATPSFSLNPGTYSGNQSLTITDATSGATIHYTTDGTTPTSSSPTYGGAVTLTTSCTVQAIAIGAATSSIRSAQYNIFSGSGGSLSGSVTAITSATTVNLTSQGSSDWAMWGYKASYNFEHKSNGNGQISNLGAYGGGGEGQFSNSIITTTWTDGSPDGNVSGNASGYYNGGGVGDGFIFTAPADANTRTLTVYVGGWESGGTLTASLSDNSAATYSNSSLSNNSTNYYGSYTITYKAANPNQTLTVKWLEASGSGNVTVQAATLQGNSTPTAATPTFSPAPGSYTSSQSVTISDSTSGAAIHYTIDGSTPTTSSPTYSGAISVTSTQTIQAIAVASGYNNSAVGGGTYTIVTRPATPTGLAASAANAQVTVSWTAVTGGTSYNLYRSTTQGGEGTTAYKTGVTSTSYTDTGLTDGSTYYYKVAAVNTAGTSGQSSEISGKPFVQAPTGLKATPGSTQVSLSWTASGGATSYAVYRSTTSGGEGTTAIASGIIATSYTNTGLTNGTKYFYKVAAVNSAGTSTQSSEVSAAPNTSSPYGGTAAAIPGTVQAENYDVGGQGIAYNVTSVNGTDNAYRTDGVDLEACTDTGGGVDLGWSAAGQWFTYTVKVATAGTYTVAFRVANGSGSSATMHLMNSSGTNLTGSVTVPNTGGWQTWTTVNATVTLPAGTQVLTVDQDSANINLNYMTFTASVPEGPYGGTASAVPGTIQAENYDVGGQGVAYNVPSIQGTDNGYRSDGVDLEVCSDTGGGVDLGWTESGQWFKYTVNVATAKTYTATFRIASGFPSGQQVAQIHIQNAAGTDLTGLVNIDATGGWQTWSNATATLSLPAGKQTLELYIDGSNAGFNINYFSLN